MKRTQLLRLLAVNLVLLPLIQLSYNLYFMTKIAEGSFHLIIFPTLIILLNFLLWCSRQRVASSIHWIFIYVGQGTSLACYFVWHYWQLEPYPDMPPGEAAFDLCMRTFLIGLWQLIGLVLIQLSTFIILKMGMTLKHHSSRELS